MKKLRSGFTLIEILIVIAVIGIISSGSFVVLTKFSKQQGINIAHENLKNTLNEAKSSAQSNVVSKCTAGILVGYQVEFNNLDSTAPYNLKEICLESGVEKTYTIKAIAHAGVNIVSTPTKITFLVLSGDVRDGDSIVTLTNGATGQEKQINVSSKGIIN
jgi:prepilin-type N-terminal cleavage/methylation domain-containing protein